MGCRLAWMLGLAALVGCDAPQAALDGPPTVRIAGSETLVELLLPRLITAHQAERGELAFEVSGGGSAQGFRQLLDGTVDLAATSRRSLPVEREHAAIANYDLEEETCRHVAAVDVVVLSVHPDNPLKSMTYDQIIGVYCTHAITDWSDFGLEPAPIRALTRDPESGSRALFEDFFCGPMGIHSKVEVSDRAGISLALAEDPAAVGFSSLADVSGAAVALRASADARPVAPSQLNVIRGSYPLYNDLYLYSAGEPNDLTASFLSWLQSPGGQEVVDEARFVPLFLRPERMDEPRPLRETVHFEMSSSEPTEHSIARIDVLVQDLQERAREDRHIVLEGYADSEEMNATELSKQRAEAVEALLSDKLPGMYFEIIPRGSMWPIAPNDTPYGRQRNRRVQIYLAADEAPVELPPSEEG